MPHRYVVLVPIKTSPQAKSRLAAGSFGPAAIQAFARDAIASAKRSPWVDEVVIVSQDKLDLGQGAWLPDSGGGLNTALIQAQKRLMITHPDHGFLAMLGDLPCLLTAELDAALVFGQDHARWFVADHHQSGTTMLGAAPGVGLGPIFGPNSATAHLASGAVPCNLTINSARLDIDTPDDLRAAQALGVGAHTARALEPDKALGAGDSRQPAPNEMGTA